MKRYVVTMYNECNCELDSNIVLAHDEDEAIQTWLKTAKPIVYHGDRIEAVLEKNDTVYKELMEVK